MKKLILIFLMLISSSTLLSQTIDTNTIIEYNIYLDSQKGVVNDKSSNGTACTAELIDECGVNFNTMEQVIYFVMGLFFLVLVLVI